ncbi:MAG: phosphoribosylamine--glycine ligase, partial [Tepidiformaceae bacterium]
MGSRVLLVGTGAREHAIAWKLRQSPHVDNIFVAPGNAGTAQVGTNIAVQPKDIDGLVKAAKDARIDFYLASMDDPQPLGLVDRLTAEGILCYGPTAAAARLEASKAFSKQFMVDHGIRTARAQAFTSYRDACS